MDYDIIDRRFGALINGNAHLEQLYTGCRWAEGPVWLGAARSVIWSDIPNNRMLRFDEAGGGVSVFRQPANKGLSWLYYWRARANWKRSRRN